MRLWRARRVSGMLARVEILRRSLRRAGGRSSWPSPVRLNRADAVRAKLADLGITDKDVTAAVAWSRKTTRRSVGAGMAPVTTRADLAPVKAPARAPGLPDIRSSASN